MNEYQRQRKRISNIKSRLKKEGFNVDFNLPKNEGKSYTQADIEKLRNISVSDVIRTAYDKEVKRLSKRAIKLEREEGIYTDVNSQFGKENETVSRKDVNLLKSLNVSNLREIAYRVDDKKYTEFQYKKEQKRIKKKMKQLKDEGYSYSDYEGLQYSERPTKDDLDYLKSISNKDIEDNTYRKAEDTDMLVNKNSDKKRQKEGSNYRDIDYHIYKTNWEIMIGRFPSMAKPYLDRVTDDLERIYGEKEVYLNIGQAMKDGYILTYDIAYNEDKLADFVRGILTYFNKLSGFDSEFEDLMEEIAYFSYD